jgi:ketosteroid isomerase-like protein
MSQENVELTYRANDAANRRDIDAFIALLHPDVEWEESGDVLPGLRGTYHGRAEVRKWAEELMEPWESLHMEIEEITEASDGRVFFEFFITARGGASGVETELRGWQVLWFVDGKIEKRQVLWTRDEALEAAGLSE